MTVDITLDHLRRQVVIDPHQQGTVVVPWCPEGTRVEAAEMIGSPVIKACQLRVRRIITNFSL